MQEAGNVKDVVVPVSRAHNASGASFFEQLERYSLALECVASLPPQPDSTGARPHRRFGYVSFMDEAGAARAIQTLNGRSIYNQPLTVAAATPPASEGRGASAAASRPAGHSYQAPHALFSSGGTSLAPSVRSAVDGMSPLELWNIASEMKRLADSDAVQAKALLLQYPMLAHALLIVEEKLGMMKQQQQGVLLAQQQQQLLMQQQQQQLLLQQQQQQHQMLLQQQQQHQMQQLQQQQQQQLGGGSTAGGASADASSDQSAGGSIDEEQVALLRGILAMGDSDVAVLPEEQRQGVQQVRDALNLPLSAINAMPEAQRDELLQMRSQLQATLGIAQS